jgi:histidinol dehydrogenase
VCDSAEEMVREADRIASEHVQVMTCDPKDYPVSDMRVRAAFSVFGCCVRRRWSIRPVGNVEDHSVDGTHALSTYQAILNFFSDRPH